MINKLNNAVVAITGAGSGIGRELALQCSSLGAKLALSDINEAQLDETKALILKLNNQSQVMCSQVNVADKEQMFNWAANVGDHFGGVNIIINNAGVALAASVDATDIEDFEWLMSINFWGVVNGTKAFLPFLKKAEWGHVVNISSLFGLVSIPNQSAYNAAKFAVRGFTESLRIEMILSHKTVEVSCVHPGGIKTNIANAGRFKGQVGNDTSVENQKKQFNDHLARTTAPQAANIIIKGINKNKPRILVGSDAKLMDIIQRIIPARYQKLVARFMP
ncbi:MAG: SDR family NAD(P)-dependent oxidoreductase [Bermanella sp.]